MALVILALVAGVSFFVVALVMMREFGWRTFYRIGSDPHKRALLERMRMFDVVRTARAFRARQLPRVAADHHLPYMAGALHPMDAAHRARRSPAVGVGHIRLRSARGQGATGIPS